MGFDYTHYLNANLQMSEWAGCNSRHLVSAIMREVAQMCHSNGCRARGITRESSLASLFEAALSIRSSPRS